MNTFLHFLELLSIVLGAWCVYCTIGLFLAVKNSFLYRFLVFCGAALVLCMVIYIGDWANLPPTFLFFLVCLWVSCDGSRAKRLYTGLLLSCVYFSFSALHDNYFLSYPSFGKSLFALVFYHLLRRLSPPKDYELSPALWKLLFLLTVTPVGILLSVVLLDNSAYTSNRVYLLDFVLLLLSLFSFSGLLWTASVLARQQELEAESSVFQASRVYYESLEQQNFEIRKLKHDMANHLQTLLHLPDQEKNPYIQNLLRTPALFQTVKYCGDNTVNIILSSKAAAFSQHHTAFHVRAEIPASLPFESPDLCTVLCNALDNALEACTKLPEEQRQVFLNARFSKGIFTFELTNPLPPEPSSFQTTKKEKALHGFGLKSIQAAAEKNSGGMEVTVKDGIFSLFVYLCHAHR